MRMDVSNFWSLTSPVGTKKIHWSLKDEEFIEIGNLWNKERKK